MRRTWRVEEAKERFSEFLEASLTDGPQIVTKCGAEIAVLVSVDRWRRLERHSKRDIKAPLLAPEARTETLTPPRAGLGASRRTGTPGRGQDAGMRASGQRVARASRKAATSRVITSR